MVDLLDLYNEYKFGIQIKYVDPLETGNCYDNVYTILLLLTNSSYIIL